MSNHTPTQLLLPEINRAEVDQLMADLDEAGVELAVVGERLRFRPSAAVKSALLERLKLHKLETIARVRNAGGWDSRLQVESGCPVSDGCTGGGSAHRRLPADFMRHGESSEPGDSSTVGLKHPTADVAYPGAQAKNDTKPHTNVGRRSTESLNSSESFELARLISWFHAKRGQLSPEPFQLRPGCWVVFPDRFYEALHRDIVAGPAGLRARYGLANDLSDLKRLLEHPLAQASSGRPESATTASTSICQTHSRECGHAGPAGRPSPILQHVGHQ
jgi:hypothetical protein